MFQRDSECYPFFCHFSVGISPPIVYLFISHFGYDICFRIPQKTAKMKKKGYLEREELIG
jgi:hypothetical protein